MKHKTLGIAKAPFLLMGFLFFSSWFSAITAATINDSLTKGQIAAALLILKHSSTHELASIDAQPEAEKNIIRGNSVTFSVTASSNETLTYQWQKNGVDIPEATSSSYTIAVTTLDDSGIYRVIIRNLNGSVTSTTTLLSVVNDTIVPTVTVTPLTTSDTSPALSGTVDGTGTTVASVTIDLAGKTYSASVSGTTWSIAKNIISPPLTPGTYDITATAKDAENNTAQDTTSNELLIAPGAPTLVSALASRTSGVAPLGVFFDAVNKAGVMQPPEVSGHREFADLHYQWDFGDATSGNWAVSGKSKNSSSGYAVAHVYETPGTYTANLTVTDLNGLTANYKVEIEVQDPDVIFAGNNTICLSTGSDFTGCPSGALEVTTNNFSNIQDHIAEGKQILLRRGDTWSTADSFALGTAGPLIIGAFGECLAPDLRGICSNAPLINSTSQGEWDAKNETYLDDYNHLFRIDHVNNTRIMDLHFVDQNKRDSAISGGYEMKQLLMLRLKTKSFGAPLGNGHWETEGHDGVMMVDNDASQGRDYIAYVGSKRLVLMGNRFDDASVSHVVRVWHAHKGYIAHNEISGASTTSTRGRHALKLHSPYEQELVGASSNLNPWTGTEIPAAALLGTRTRYVVISDNIFGAAGPAPVSIGPQDDSHDERLMDIVVEKNRFFPAYGTISCCSTAVASGISVSSRYVTVRNNIFNGDGSGKYYTAIDIHKRGIEPAPLGVRVFNNTIYKKVVNSNDGYRQHIGIAIDNYTQETLIQNNLVQLTDEGHGQRAFILSTNENILQDHNLFTLNAGLINPDTSNHLQKNFALSFDSAGIDQGIDVPVFEDFNGNTRPLLDGTYDLGAFEYSNEPPFCGNSIIEGTEECDGKAGVGQHQMCLSNCTLVDLPYCGDSQCNGTETNASCPTDCTQSGGGNQGTSQDFIENYGANAFYKPYYGTLTISPNNDDTSTITYTGTDHNFNSEYLNKEFVAFRIHKNPLKTNTIDKYFPNTLGSRYSKVIEVVDNKTLIVNFAYNGGNANTPITSENTSGYFFFDNKAAFTSAITSSERGETITLKEGNVYVTKGGWNAVTPSNIILKTQNEFTTKARIKISAEDVMGQRGSNLPETGYFLSTLFKLDVADFDIKIRDINVIGPHYSAIAMQDNSYYYGLFGGTTHTAQQARTLELYGSDDWTEYYELRDNNLLQHLPDGYNFLGPNFIFGIIYAGKHDADKVTDMLVLNCINSNMHLRNFSSMKTNNGAGIYKRIIGESPEKMSEIIEQDLPENYINPVALSSDMAIKTKLKVLDDADFGGKRVFKITGYGSWLQLANQYWWGGTNTNQGQNAYIRVQHNMKSYDIKLGNEGDWNYLTGTDQVIDSFIDNATIRGVFQIPKAGDQFTIGDDFKAGNNLVVIDKNTIEVWGWSIQAGDQLNIDGVIVDVIATEEKYKKVEDFDPDSPLSAGYIHYLSLTLNADINLSPSAISIQMAQLEFLLDGNEHAVELTQTGGVVGHLFYDDFNMPYHFENVNIRGFFRGSDREFKDTEGSYIGWMLPNVDLLDERRIRIWRNATYSDDNASPGQWMTSIQNATAEYSGLPIGTYRTLFDGEKTKISQLFMDDCTRDLAEIKNNPDLTHARLCNPKIGNENIQAHGTLLLYTTEGNQINIGSIDATNPGHWSSVTYYPDGGTLNIQNLLMNEGAGTTQGVLHVREQSTAPYSLNVAQGNAFVRINNITENHIDSDITLTNWKYGLYPYTGSDDGYDFFQNNVLLNNPVLSYDNYCSKINITDSSGANILANCF